MTRKRFLIGIFRVQVATIIFMLPAFVPVGLGNLGLEAQGCPPVANTPSFSIAYGPVQLDGAQAPVGTIVEVISPRDDVVGCIEVSAAGSYGAMYVYGEDTSVSPPIPGMRAGETATFRVDGYTATATPELLWQNDRELHQIALTAQTPDPVEIALSPGLNLVPWRLEPPPNVQGALAEIAAQGGQAPEAYRWLSKVDTWEGHVLDKPFNNFALALGQSYFVKATSASTWQPPGQQPASPVPVQLDPTWTLIGLPVLPGPMTARGLLDEATAQGGACTEIYRWDAPTGNWAGYITGMGGDGFAVTVDEGYFVKCANAITYSPTGASTQLGPQLAWQVAKVPEALEPEADPIISDIQITNRRDVAFSVTWQTDRPSMGWVEYAACQDCQSYRVHNDLGQGTTSQVHHVTLAGLAPETTYYFRIHSGNGSTDPSQARDELRTGSVDDSNRMLYQVTTRATELPPAPFLAYGQVEASGGAPAVGSVVRAWLVNERPVLPVLSEVEGSGAEGPVLSGAEGGNESEPLSTLVDGQGEWVLSLESSLDLPGDSCDAQLKLQAIGPRGDEAVWTQPWCDLQPAPTLILPGQDSNRGISPILR